MKIFQSILCIMLLGISVASWGQEKKAYRLFDANGKEVGYREMMKVLKNQDVVFLGEVHNCAIAHWMEYEIVKDLCEVHKGKLAIGLEMLEADNQLVLDEYVGRLISSDRFEEEARLWPNYQTDYAAVVGLGREYGLKVVATNVPRRYANMVKNGGFEALDKLSAEAKATRASSTAAPQSRWMRLPACCRAAVSGLRPTMPSWTRIPGGRIRTISSTTGCRSW